MFVLEFHSWMEAQKKSKSVWETVSESWKKKFLQDWLFWSGVMKRKVDSTWGKNLGKIDDDQLIQRRMKEKEEKSKWIWKKIYMNRIKFGFFSKSNKIFTLSMSRNKLVILMSFSGSRKGIWKAAPSDFGKAKETRRKNKENLLIALT